MLVLTRKKDEQIVIGDNIKITLLRVQGNSVRIGIDAPRDIRILRGEVSSAEVDADDIEAAEQIAVELHEQVFAHPKPDRQPSPDKQIVVSDDRMSRAAASPPLRHRVRKPTAQPSARTATGARFPADRASRKIYMGTVDRRGNGTQLDYVPTSQPLTSK